MSISVVKCSWVKCGEVLQCSDVLLVLFYCFVHGCMFGILLFNYVSFVFLLLCLCILINKYILINKCSVFSLQTGILRLLTLRRLMSYIYGAPILDVSRSHTTTQHSR